MKKIILLLAGAAILTACSQSGSSPSSGGSVPPSPVVNYDPLSISNAAMIPLSSESGNFSSVIYVNNSSNKEVNNVHYSVINPANNKVLSISAAYAKNCENIPANSSCPLGIDITAALVNGAIVQADYSYNDKATTAKQIINVAKQSFININGVGFSGSTNVVTSSDANYGYATLYLVGGGNGSSYTVNDIKLSDANAKIVNGYTKGMIIASGFAQPINIQVPKSNGQLKQVTVTVDSSTNSSATKSSLKNSLKAYGNYSNSVTLGVFSTSGPIVMNTQPQILNLSESTIGSVLIYNAGNADADTLAISPAPAGVVSLDSTTCGATLPSLGSCEYNYSINKGAAIGQDGSLTVDYTPSGPAGDSLSIGLGWYESSNSPMLAMVADNTSLSFNATESTTGTITYTNVGGYDFTNFTPSVVTASGSAITSVTTNGCSTTLVVGASCTYQYSVTDAVTEVGILHAEANANYQQNNSSQSYFRLLPINYASLAYAAAITIAPSPLNLSIMGDNLESDTKTFTITNSGTAPTSSFAISNTSFPAYMQQTTSTCAGSLNSGDSCDITVKLGPVAKEVTESGTVTYTVTYAGGQTPADTTAAESVNYIVTANNQGLVITSITPVNSTSGAGETNTDPILFSGGAYASADEKIEVLYTNSGTNALTIQGYSQPFNPYWSVSGCTIGTVLAAGDTCTLTYTSLLAQNVLYGALNSATVSQNVALPYFVVSSNDATGHQFYLQPLTPNDNSPTLYAQTNVAVVTPVATYTQGTHTMAYSYGLSGSFSDYGNIVLQTTSENYMSTGTETLSSNCVLTPDSATGLLAQQCTFSSTDSSGSVAYTVNSNIWSSGLTTVPLDSIYTITSPADKPVVLNPRQVTTSLVQ